MLAVLLFQDAISIPWDKIIYGAQGFAVLAIILIFFLRVLPTWKEVKLKELDVRKDEAVASGQQAESQKAIADVLYKVAIEQRRAADSVKVLQRVNARSVDALDEEVTAIDARLERLEKERHGKNVAHTISAEATA